MKEVNTSKRRQQLACLPNLRLAERYKEQTKENHDQTYTSSIFNPNITNTNISNSNISNSNDLGKKIKIITEQLNSLMNNHDSHLNTSNSRLEERFQKILLPIPQLEPLENNGRKDVEKVKRDRKLTLEKWLGRLCHEVFSVTFSLFEKEKLNDKQSRAFCCQNLLLNLIQLIKTTKIEKDEIKNLNSCLKQELLPYFVAKYPISMEQQVNIQFASKIVEIDSLGSNENDLIGKDSCIKFRYRLDKNYGKQIMLLLNKIIQLPGKKLIGSGPQKSLFKHFSHDMDNFFKKIEEQKFTLEMNNYDLKTSEEHQTNVRPQTPNFISATLQGDIAIGDLKVTLEKQKQKEQYRQNVKSYTKKSIGRKISQNVPIYSPVEIEEGQLQLEDPALMRIISKWCDELMYNFNVEANILNKEDQFRMKDGSLRLLKRKHSILLAQLLKQQKKTIDEYINKVNENNYESQLVFGRQQIPAQLLKFSEEECEVGLFASSIMRNYEAYLVGYVNVIIHALMTATKHYEQMVKAYEYKQDQYGKQIKKWMNKQITFAQLLRIAYSYRLTQVKVVYESLVPELVTFKVGDILRCKCTSKQKQIIALYTYLQRLSKDPKSDIKIMKLRNRLQLGTKDILINILYKNTMLVEMQLGIVTARSKFIDFSNKFNHTLYELKRSQFGPIIQLCNIWINDDVKSDFYIEKMKLLNIRKPKKYLKQDHICQGSSLEYPFSCPECDYFYNDFSYKIKHTECADKSCRIKLVCSICQTEKYDYKKFQQICPGLPNIQILGMKQNEKYCQYKERRAQEVKERNYLQGEQQFGLLINLKGDQIKHNYFIVRQVEKKQVIITLEKFQYGSKAKHFKVLKQLSTKKEIETFKKQYLIFSSLTIKQVLADIDTVGNKKPLTKFLTNYYFQKRMNYARKNLKTVITSIDGNLKSENFNNLQGEFPMVNKICFYGNDIEQIELVSNKFKNCQIIDLGDNELTSLFVTLNTTNYLNKLKCLYLNYNKIALIKPQFIDCVINLQEFELGNNALQGLPKNFQKLTKLKILNLSRNKFKKLPEEITNLPNLQILNMYAEEHYAQKLVSLPDCIGNLKKLRKLNLNFNDIRQLPETFGELENLQILYALDNNIEKLPSSFKKLTNLLTLNLGKNQFDQIPQEIGFLTKLEILNLSFASKKEKPSKKIPQSFCELQNIRMLDISLNHITELPQNLGHLKALETLFIHDNKIKIIPKSIGQLSKLRLFYASNNQISFLPAEIEKLHSLIKMTLNDTKLRFIPIQIKGLTKLKMFQCNKTFITKIPEQMYELQQLKQLLIKDNEIQTINEKITQKLPKLKKFQISQQKLDDNSKKHVKTLLERIKIQRNKSKGVQEQGAL